MAYNYCPDCLVNTINYDGKCVICKELFPALAQKGIKPDKKHMGISIEDFGQKNVVSLETKPILKFFKKEQNSMATVAKKKITSLTKKAATPVTLKITKKPEAKA
jgi:hypothetical protein